MLRILSPDEQACLTMDAQAMIYKYRGSEGLSQRQFEDWITEVVTISRMRQLPSDGNLAAAILRGVGESGTWGLQVDSSAVLPDLSHRPS